VKVLNTHALAAAGFAILLSAVGCTKKSEESKDAASKSVASEAVAGPERKVLKVSRTSDPKTLDPQAQLDSASADIINSVYDTLLEYHYLKRPYEMTPSLLKKIPEIDPADPLTYVFELKEGVKFRDDKCFKDGKGRELVADDVLYTIKRFADANINVNSWFMLEGVVNGLDDYHAKTQKLGKDKVDHLTEPVAGLKKLDTHKFSITLTKKNPLALFAFASAATAIVASEAVKFYGEEFRYNPVGTGAFVLKEYRKKQEMIFVKNPSYHLKYPSEGEAGDQEAGLLLDAGKQLPLLDEVSVEFIPEPQPEMLKFQNGELSWAALDRNNFTKMASKSADGKFTLNKEFASLYTLYLEPSLDISYFLFNMKDSLIGKNKLLRQAISYAIDADAYVSLIRNGRGRKLNTVVPFSIAGSEVQIGNQMFNFDVEKAKKLLAEAGFPGGKGLKPIVLTFGDTSSTTKDIFEFYRAALANIGVQVTPEYLTFPKYLQTMDDKNFQMAVAAWAADYPDAENFYQLLFSGSAANNSGFKNAEYDKLYSEIRFMENGPARFELLKKMSAILKDEAPITPIYSSAITGLIQKWVKNFKRNVMNDRPYKYISVDTQRIAKGSDVQLPH
jgi:ABC-type transport system substrate-binding protein